MGSSHRRNRTEGHQQTSPHEETVKGSLGSRHANHQTGLYAGYVRPTIEYGMGTLSIAANTNLQKSDKNQNSGLRIITGSVKSTPITEMEAAAEFQDLDERREEKNPNIDRQILQTSTASHAHKNHSLTKKLL